MRLCDWLIRSANQNQNKKIRKRKKIFPAYLDDASESQKYSISATQNGEKVWKFCFLSKILFLTKNLIF